MITEDRGLTMLAGANPVPQLDLIEVDFEAAKYLATLEQRSSEVTQIDTKAKDGKQKKKRNATAFLVAAGVVIVAGIGFLVSNNSDSADIAGASASPAQVLDDYIAAYNSGDIDGVMALFSEESVITGHPFSASSTGLAEIRALHGRDMAIAASENAYTISNVEVTGDTVTWDHVWTNSEGNDFCQFGQSAVVEEGIILSWTWPSGGGDCP